MALRYPPAVREREQWLSGQPHAPRYWFSDAGWLLQDARAIALGILATLPDGDISADLRGLATEIEGYLLDTLSVLRLSREDVELTFERLRGDHPAWPAAIPPESWTRLARTHYLDDIGDVLLGGGDFWMAIEEALFDEFRSAR